MPLKNPNRLEEATTAATSPMYMMRRARRSFSFFLVSSMAGWSGRGQHVSIVKFN